MFNWIGMNLVNFLIPNMPRMLDSDWGASASDRTAALANANPGAILPRLGLDRLFHYSYMNIGIILAIVVSIVMWVILKKTTFGYELKACGNNRTPLCTPASARKRTLSCPWSSPAPWPVLAAACSTWPRRAVYSAPGH